MWLWRWVTRDRWAIWLYVDGERSCVMSTHRTWVLAHRHVHEYERNAVRRYPPVWYQIERITRQIRHTEFCIER